MVVVVRGGQRAIGTKRLLRCSSRGCSPPRPAAQQQRHDAPQAGRASASLSISSKSLTLVERADALVDLADERRGEVLDVLAALLALLPVC